jgi:hypothetical protein
MLNIQIQLKIKLNLIELDYDNLSQLDFNPPSHQTEKIFIYIYMMF